MKKSKILFLFSFLAIMLIGGYFFMRPHWRLPFDRLSPFEAIPASTGLVIGFDLFSEDSSFQDQLWALNIKNLNYLLDSCNLDNAALWDNWWMIPKQLEQGGEMSYTFIGNGNSQFLSSWKAGRVGISMSFGDGEVFGLGIHTDDPLYFACVHNLFIVGEFPYQIEEILSLLKYKNQTWQKEVNFQKIQETKKIEKKFRVIIQSEFIAADMPAQWMSNEEKKMLSQHFDWLWMELEKNDSIGSIAAYGAQEVVGERATWKLAANDWQWVPTICQSAIPLYLSEQSPEWLNYITPWIGDGGWELTLSGKKAAAENRKELWVLPIADTVLYRKGYAGLTSEIGLLDKVNYQNFHLIQLKRSTVFSALSDRSGLQMWLCELDGALLCGVSREDMERWLDYYMVGGRIDNEIRFLQQQVLNGKESSDLIGRWGPLSDNETNLFTLFYPREAWAHSGQLLANVHSEKTGVLSFNGSVQAFTPRITGPGVAWTLPLQMKGAVRLLSVKDIYTEEITAFAVQDEEGHFIFFDKEANILWEQAYVAPVIGDLWAVPWHNGIHHLLMATTKGIQLWDENGAEIDQLPILSAPPSSGMRIAHFGIKEALAVLIATTDGKIWSFTPQGELLSGWPIVAYEDSTSISSLLHYQLATNDLIVSWADSLGWKGFDKSGKQLFETKNSGIHPIASAYGQQLSDDSLGSSNRLVMAYENGIAQVVNFTGETFNIPFSRGAVDHFLFSPLWGDARADYIVQQGRLIHLFGYESSTFSERWQYYLAATPDTIIDLSPYGLISINDNKKELWLLNGEGQLLLDTPLAGQQNAFLLETSTQGLLLITLLGTEVYAYALDW